MAQGSDSARPWYVALKGKKQGPVSEEKLAGYLRSGKLPGAVKVWTKGMANWARADQTGLAAYLPAKPQPAAKPAPQPAPKPAPMPDPTATQEFSPQFLANDQDPLSDSQSLDAEPGATQEFSPDFDWGDSASLSDSQFLDKINPAKKEFAAQLAEQEDLLGDSQPNASKDPAATQEFSGPLTLEQPEQPAKPTPGKGQATPDASAPPTPEGGDDGWFVMVNDERLGPIDEPTLAGLLKSEKLLPKTLAWTKGMEEWRPAWKTPLIKYIGRDDEDEYKPLQGGPEAEEACKALGAINMLFVLALVASVGLSALGLVGLYSPNPLLGLMLFGLCLTIWVVSSAAGSIVLYRCWYVIQDGDPALDPKRAVGFMFIPFFNMYWVFQAHHTLAMQMNLYMAQRNILGRFVSTGTVMAMCASFVVLCLAPLAGFLPSVGPYLYYTLAVVFMFTAVLAYQSLTKAAQGVLLYKGDPPDLPDNSFPLSVGGGVAALMVLCVCVAYFMIPHAPPALDTDQAGNARDTEQWDLVPEDSVVDWATTDPIPIKVKNAATSVSTAMNLMYAQSIAEGRPFNCAQAADEMIINRWDPTILLAISSAGGNDEVDGCTITTTSTVGDATYTMTWTPGM